MFVSLDNMHCPIKTKAIWSWLWHVCPVKLEYNLSELYRYYDEAIDNTMIMSLLDNKMIPLLKIHMKPLHYDEAIAWHYDEAIAWHYDEAIAWL